MAGGPVLSLALRRANTFEHISVHFDAACTGHAAITSYTYKVDKGRRSLPVKTTRARARR